MAKLEHTAKYPDIRRSLRSLFPDSKGGDNRRHIHGKIAMGKTGVFMVTSENQGFTSDRMYVVRKITNEDGRVSAKPLASFSWGHVATQKMMELAG